jgi:hypothetical protein
MHTVELVNLIVSLAVALVLLTIGIHGLVKQDYMVTGVSMGKLKVSEWVLVALGALLLVFSVWSYVEGSSEHY